MPLIDRVSRRRMLFPTLLRGTAQGLMVSIVRIALGGWILLLQETQAAGPGRRARGAPA